MTDSKRELDKQLAAVNGLADKIAARAPALLERNERGGSAERDGFPSGGDSGGGSRSSDRTSSTERTVLERLADEEPDRRVEQDQVAAAVRALKKHLDDATKSLLLALAQVALGEHLASHDGRHSNAPTPCLGCDRIVFCTTEDPLRSGLCGACSTAWYRWKASEEGEGRVADRSRFCRTRRAEEAA